MPIRSASWNVKLQQFGKHTHYLPSAYETTGSYEHVVLARESRITEVGNRSWEQNLKRGIGATTNLSAYRTFVDGYQVGTSHVIAWTDNTHSRKYWEETCVGIFAGLNMTDPPTAVDSTGSALAYNRALSSLMNDYNNKKGILFQGAVALGEWEETVKMVEQKARILFVAIIRLVAEMIDWLRSLKRGDLRKLEALQRTLIKNWRKFGRDGKRLKKLNKKFSDLYLEGVFGWLPLINDLNDALSALNELNTRVPFVYVHLKGKGTNTVQIGSVGQTNAVLVPGYSTPSAYSRAVTSDVTVEHSYKFYGMASVHAGDGTLANLFGFDPVRDFAPTVWELIPYSFVADYFTNLGDLIEAQCTRLYNINWLNQGYQGIQRTRYRVQTLNGFSGYQEYHLAGGQAQGRTVQVSRTRVDNPSDILGTRQFEFKVPKPIQWLNLGALGASSHFGKK